MLCESCNANVILGVLCHEHGCPDAWRTEQRECAWCGQTFTPITRHQACCDDECIAAYYGR